MRVANILKQASANATAGATEDQASDHTAQTKGTREQFELNITEDPPTPEQVQTILEYVGKSGAGTIVKGAKDEKEALKKFKESRDNLSRPLVGVDMVNSKLVCAGLTSYRLWIGIMEGLLPGITSLRF